MSVLVTGGLGYIGSHIVRLLTQRGVEVVAVDSDASRARRHDGDRLAHVEILDLVDASATRRLRDILISHAVGSVIHLAGRKSVPESIERPAWYWRQNMGALESVLDATDSAGVGRVIFSSSAAVYGAPQGGPIREATPFAAMNPYGHTKVAGEWLLEAAVRASGRRAVSLRYFNVAGTGWTEFADNAGPGLVPSIIRMITAGRRPVIFGSDYPTPDGTCVRDLVHVLDLADAHVAALEFLEGAGEAYGALNVGSGTGYTVREIVETTLTISGSALEPDVQQRRRGDPPVSVADTTAIHHRLGWSPSLSLRDCVSSAWDARAQ